MKYLKVFLEELAAALDICCRFVDLEMLQEAADRLLALRRDGLLM